MLAPCRLGILSLACVALLISFPPRTAAKDRQGLLLIAGAQVSSARLNRVSSPPKQLSVGGEFGVLRLVGVAGYGGSLGVDWLERDRAVIGWAPVRGFLLACMAEAGPIVVFEDGEADLGARARLHFGPLMLGIARFGGGSGKPVDMFEVGVELGGPLLERFWD